MKLKIINGILCGDYTDLPLKWTVLQLVTVGSNTQIEEVSKHSLIFPDYNDQSVRLQSFKYWGGVLPAQELAEAGFYMIARRDVVRCFSCNVVVQDWERTDNVMDEHRRHSPYCTFLKTFLSSAGKATNELFSPLSSIDKTGHSSIEARSKLSDTPSLPTPLDPSLNIKLPPSMREAKLPSSIRSRGSSKSPDGDNDGIIQGIRYPPSWPGQGGSKKLSDASEESFHSAESHHDHDYNMLTSIDPPKTKIMVSLTCHCRTVLCKIIAIV